MVISTRDNLGRHIDIVAVTLPDGQVNFHLVVKTPNRSRTVLETGMVLTNRDAELLIAGLGGHS